MKADLLAALAALADQWDALADAAREQTRLTHASDLSRVAYYQGVVKTYQEAAQALRDLIVPPADPPPTPPPTYLRLSESEVNALLQPIGLFARTLTLHADGVFTAVFSRLQPFTQESRIQLLSAADPRIVIIDQGKLRDSSEPFIDFAFVPR